jgi:hypothetical protein
MKSRLIRLASITLSLVTLAAALFLSFTVLRRAPNPVWAVSDPVQVPGVVTEALIQPQDDRFLPFTVQTHVIRYAFPTRDGNMRTGEQAVTGAFHRAHNRQGMPVPVTISAADPSLSAVEVRLAFPGPAGWRLGIAAGALMLAAAVAAGGSILLRRSRR